MGEQNSQNLLPTVFVIFGATGDLMERKLAPALFHLFEKGALPSLFQVVGFSRQPLTNEEFQKKVGEMIQRVGKAPQGKIKNFRKHFLYQQGLFEDPKGYLKIAELLGRKDGEWKVCSNKLFYLAVPPQYYKTIFRNLAKSGLTEPCSPEEGWTPLESAKFFGEDILSLRKHPWPHTPLTGWTRVLVEKPFGKDLKTAQELDALLGKLFKEEQIYRIDHYLGKETVQNILAFRFSNSFLQDSWNRDAIESIHIKLLEVADIAGRGALYDGLGALRDVGQNHILQLLALFTMENPGAFDGESVRKGRAKILKALRIFSEKDVAEWTLRGQYKGYREESNVNPRSKTETYFRIRAFLDTPRWQGVPIILESGKALEQEDVEVEITFRHPTPCLCPPGENTHYQNILHYHIQPKEGISVSFWVKKPGPTMVIEEKNFSFDYKTAFAGEEISDAYERLLLSAIGGDQTLFVSTDEIMASWKFVDPIIRAWKRNLGKLRTYQPYSHEPFEWKFPGERMPQELPKKEIGLIGLGKMGQNLALRLREKGWQVRAFDKNTEAVQKIKEQGITGLQSIKELVESLSKPRIIWTMVPAGTPTKEVLFGESGLISHLERGDVVIDGGNSFYEDSIQSAKKFSKKGIEFLDVGVSGGPGGARSGAALMIGGKREIFERLEFLFRDLAVPGGYAYMGKSGAGHFVKMVHNGIEYGMMEALGEGFTILRKAPFRLDLRKIAEVYNHGSVIESRLVGWLKNAFEEFGEDLKEVSGKVEHTGEGEWALKAAQKFGVPAPVLNEAFEFRVKSQTKPSYTGKILTALRNQFGGHSIKGK